MRTFEINTHHAYLNTEVVLKSNGGPCEIQDLITGVKYSVESILRIKLCAGEHNLYCAKSNQTEKVIIQDAIKLGGSNIKPEASFVSEVTPWIVVTMKDRIYFFNRETKSEFVEHNLSPASVKYIGGKANEYFIFETEDDYSIFNAITRQVTYNCNNVIYNNEHLVISDKQGELTVYDYINDVFIFQTDSQYSIHESNLFYADGDSIYRLDLGSNEINQLKCKLRTNIYQFCEGHILVCVANYGKKVHYELLDLELDNCTTMYMNYFITVFCGKKLNHTDEIYKVFEDAANNAYGDFVDKNSDKLRQYYISSNLNLSIYEILSFNVVDDKDVMDVRLITKTKGYAGVYVSYKYLRFNSPHSFIDYTYAVEIDVPKKEIEETCTPFKIDSDKGKLICHSDSQNMYISLKDGKLYETNINDNSCSEVLENIFNNNTYLNAFFSSDGGSVVAVNSDKTADILGFENLSEDRFDTTNSTVSFVNDYGVNGYKPEISITLTDSRKPIWRDPITLNVISDKDRPKCIFKSPDGNYTAENKEKLIYHDTLINSDITVEKYNELCRKYDWDYKATKEEMTQKIELREKFAAKYPDHKDLSDSKSGTYTSKFIKQLYYVFYKKIGDSTIYRILIGENVSYLNYISFSYDSRFIVLGAKLYGGSGLFILYDLVNMKTIENIGTYDDRNIYAVWMAMFSKNDNIAYYDSVPNTYLLKRKDEYKSTVQIKDKSLLCFSPSGRYIALSNQGYIAYDRRRNRNWGHQPSGNIYIHNTDNPSVEMEHYNDLGESINGLSSRAGNVASAAFSKDEKRLLAVGIDGVVIIRNLTLTSE
ncbi:MAG: hypothetical protein SNH73_01930 [Rikenellaceae bacterium]